MIDWSPGRRLLYFRNRFGTLSPVHPDLQEVGRCLHRKQKSVRIRPAVSNPTDLCPQFPIRMDQDCSGATSLTTGFVDIAAVRLVFHNQEHMMAPMHGSRSVRTFLGITKPGDYLILAGLTPKTRSELGLVILASFAIAHLVSPSVKDNNPQISTIQDF